MQSISTEARKLIAQNSGVYLRAQITFTNGSTLDLDGDDFILNTATFSQSVSPQDSFQIGSAIIGSCSLTLNNVDGRFSKYDFTGATVSVQAGIPLDKTEWVQMGTYDVDEPTALTNTITLSCYDMLSRFERPFSDVSVRYPITAGRLASAICSKCDTYLFSESFSGSSYSIVSSPGGDDDELTCLVMMGYIAQATGNFCRAKRDGSIEIGWYDDAAFAGLDGGSFDKRGAASYRDGDVADGGDFIDYSSGVSYEGGDFSERKYGIISNTSSMTVSTDDITITGVRVTAMDEILPDGSDGEPRGGETVVAGDDGYVIAWSDNPIVPFGRAAASAALCKHVTGVTLRPFSCSMVGQPQLDAGDPVYVVDPHGNTYRSYLTSYTYRVGQFADARCDAESARKNAATKSTAYARRITRAMNSVRRSSAKALANRAGLYMTVMPEGPDDASEQSSSRRAHGMPRRLAAAATGVTTLDASDAESVEKQTVTYLHDKPSLGDSNVVIRLSPTSLQSSNDGGSTTATVLDAANYMTVNEFNEYREANDAAVASAAEDASANRLVSGKAVSDSSDGSVSVVISDDGVDGSENTDAIDARTEIDVRSGDSVVVRMSGDILNGIDQEPVPTVVGVVGGGDRTKADIQAVSDSLAETDAGLAAVRSDADAHEAEIAKVKQDIADYKASAQSTYATKTEVDEKTGAITKTLTADYTKTADLAATEAVKAAKKAGTTAQSQLADYMESNDAAVADAKAAGTGASAALDSYKGVVSETYAEKTELTEAVNQLSSTMSSNYTAFTDYRTSNDQALSKAQSDATDAQSAIDSYKASNDKAVADAKKAGTDAQSQLGSYKSSNDQAVAAAKKAGTDAQANLDSYRGTTDQRLDELQNVADNAIESWYLKGAPSTSNAPAKDWTTDALKRQHAGDLYMDTDTGYSYRWSGTEWVQVKDSDVTKALKEIESVKTDYATKSELSATDTELSGKVSDALTTAKSYTDSSVEQEVTARNAAIKAQADSISLDVSRTYTKSETFSAYQSDADGRIATANANASTAVSTAKTAASDAATAKTNASTAVDTANAASSNASKAVSTANSAASTASTAKSTADAAKSSASSAVSTANAASSTAGTAKSTADAAQAKADDAWARTLRVEVMSAPADAAGDTSALTATVWRGGQRLTEQEVAMMGLLAWYVGGQRVATGSTYTCAAGTAVECRVEA